MLLWNLIKLPFWNVRSGPQLWNNTIDKKTTELVTIELLTTGLLTTELWITELVTTELLKIELWTTELVTTELLTTELWKYEFFDNLTFWQVQLSIIPFLKKFSCQKFDCPKFRCQNFSCQEFSCQKFSCRKFSCRKFSCGKFSCQKFGCQKFSCRKFSSLFYSETKTGKTCNPLIWTTKRRNEHWAISFNFIPTTPLIWSVTKAKNSIYCTTVPNLILLFTYLSKSWLRDYYDLWNG